MATYRLLGYLIDEIINSTIKFRSFMKMLLIFKHWYAFKVINLVMIVCATHNSVNFASEGVMLTKKLKYLLIVGHEHITEYL